MQRKQRKHGQLIYSPSDLIRFVDNEAICWFDRYDLERPGELTPDEPDAHEELIAAQGNSHEMAFLHKLMSERDVADVGSADNATTLAAMREGREIIYQAKLENEEFAGYADFLCRVNGASSLGSYHYEVWDTKLARSLKPYFVIQLCFYAEMLEAVQGRLPEHVSVVLGDGSRQTLRVQDFFFYYRAVKRAFLEQQRCFDPECKPILSGMADYGKWNRHVESILRVRDDISFVANIRTSQIEKLAESGIRSMQSLADSALDRVPGMEAATFLRLRDQARLQIESRRKKRPSYRLIAPDPERPQLGLGKLPPASSSDVCFDMEGYPFVEGGLEYLLGAVYSRKGEPAFRDWWAHDSRQEKAAFEQFVKWAHARWRKDPSMHIYHYAAYEVTAVKRLMCRYACCEAEVDDLLRNGVFIDLYSIVRQALLVGEPAYSLKNIEHLYMPRRTAEVESAGDSIVFYNRWLQSPDGADWRSSETLRLIRDYNEADCRSTWELLQWLRDLQRRAHIPYVTPIEDVKVPGEELTARAALAQEMLAEIPEDRSAEPDRWRVHELLAHLLEFHRREDKPSWWRLFERAGMSEEQLMEDSDCLGRLERTNRAAELVKRSYRYEYSFPPQESKLREGSECHFAHDLKKIRIEAIDYDTGRLTFLCGVNGNPPPDRLSLIPNEIVPAKVIVDSIQRTVEAYRSTGELPNAFRDFLYRTPPRLRNHRGGPVIVPGETLLDAVKDVVRRMKNTTLYIQGPPGSGKTTIGGELIASLIAAGKRVGVISNSHRAICLLLKAAAESAERDGQCFTGAKAGADEEDDPIHSFITPLPANGDVWKLPELPQLLGGTAWVFSRDEAVGQFDYLFVDEAGQVSLANLCGIAPATRNIVLLGDQMQLSQPVQGVHPGKSGSSVLEYLLGDQATIPEDRGIFLPHTFRMRPELCTFISEGIYEGRLMTHATVLDRQMILSPSHRHRIHKTSGVLYIPVEHQDRSCECPEEVQAVAEIVRELYQHKLQMAGKRARPIAPADILIVSPFNLQVKSLQTALPQIRVGTVDRFQGQQAPIVIYSMTSSEGDSSPRGLDFLFNRNRLNVAISRAQIMAVIVGSQQLERTRCSRLEQMKLVNLFCHAIEAGRSGAQSVYA